MLWACIEFNCVWVRRAFTPPNRMALLTPNEDLIQKWRQEGLQEAQIEERLFDLHEVQRAQGKRHLDTLPYTPHPPASWTLKGVILCLLCVCVYCVCIVCAYWAYCIQNAKETPKKLSCQWVPGFMFSSFDLVSCFPPETIFPPS